MQMKTVLTGVTAQRQCSEDNLQLGEDITKSSMNSSFSFGPNFLSLQIVVYPRNKNVLQLIDNSCHVILH